MPKPTHKLRFPALLPTIAALGLLVACGGSDAEPAGGQGGISADASSGAPPNVLLILLDDVGVESMGCYGSPDARTPVMDGLAATGVRFDNAWANPMCSPTRATIMTGKYAFRTGVGRVFRADSGESGLPLSELCLPQAIEDGFGERGVHTALFGKWHLGTHVDGPGHAVNQGFDVFRGTMENIGERGLKADFEERGKYFDFEEVVDGKLARRQGYATTVNVDDALGAIGGYGDVPWFVTVSFNSAHMPFHAPPAELLTKPFDRTQVGTDYRGAFLAMLEAMDTEIGRLLADLPEGVRARTNVIVLSDNGTTRLALPADFPRGLGKGTLSESGVHVPLIVQGPSVASPGRASGALVNSSDLYGTCLDLMGLDPQPAAKDSISFAPVLLNPDHSGDRDWILAERFFKSRDPAKPDRDHVVLRGQRYKIFENRSEGQTSFFDLESDPLEFNDLLKAKGREGLSEEQRAEFDRLRGALAALNR